MTPVYAPGRGSLLAELLGNGRRGVSAELRLDVKFLRRGLLDIGNLCIHFMCEAHDLVGNEPQKYKHAHNQQAKETQHDLDGPELTVDFAGKFFVHRSSMPYLGVIYQQPLADKLL